MAGKRAPERHTITPLAQAALVHIRRGRPTTRAAHHQEGAQTRRNTGWLFAHHTRIALPTMLEPVIGPQYRLSHEIARLSPST